MGERVFAGAAVFVAALAVYAASPVSIQSDSVWSIPIAASLYLRGDPDLDEYREAVEASGHYAIHPARGRLQGYFPLGASILALPFVAATDAVVSLAPGLFSPGFVARWQRHFRGTGAIDVGVFARTERWIASFYTALAVLFFFLAVRREVTPAAALVTTAAFAFGTAAWSTASRVLWQHGLSMLTASLAIWLLTLPGPGRRVATALGAVAAAAFVVRPTNAVVGLAIGALYLLRRPRQLPWLVSGALALALPFAALNVHLYETVLPPYYLPQRLAPGSRHVWEALAGNLVSPARGLLVFSPVLLAGLAAFAVRLRSRVVRDHEVAFLAIVLLHWIVISTFPHWWGGHSIGPRYFSDVVPYCAYFLAAPFEAFVRAPARRPVRGALVATALVFSVAVNARGAIRPEVHAWNDGPPNVEEAPARLWDWTDPQFLR